MPDLYVAPAVEATVAAAPPIVKSAYDLLTQTLREDPARLEAISAEVEYGWLTLVNVPVDGQVQPWEMYWVYEPAGAPEVEIYLFTTG